MSKDQNFENLAKEIIKAVGGKENISYFTHCVTRLRINLKDEGLVDEGSIKNLKGVLGSQFSAGQFQVIIGKDVVKVYEPACALIGLTTEKGIEETLDGHVKKKVTIKGVFNSCLDALSSCLVSLLPVVIAGGMLRMVHTLLGPTMLGLITENSDTYRLLSFAADAAFYFLPIFGAFTASKKFKTSPLISMLIGAILVHPNLIEIVTSGEAFSVIGIPMPAVRYASSVIPIILIVWGQSYVERFLNRFIPEMVRFAFAPALTVLIMLPLSLTVLGPAGTYIGTLISNVLLFVDSIFGPFSPAIISALWLLLVTTGMHTTLRTVALTQLMEVGYDTIVLPAAMATGFATFAVGLAFALRIKNKEKKSLGISCALAQLFGGASEPTLFGILMPFKRLWGCLMVGAFAGGLYMGIMKVACYIMAPSVYLAPMSFGGPKENTIHGLIGCAIAFIVTFGMIYFVGVTKEMEE